MSAHEAGVNRSSTPASVTTEVSASSYSSRWSSARPITASRSASVETPSSPNPSSSECGVAIALPTGKPDASVRMKLLTLGALPSGGPVIAQPSRPVSNDVLVPSGGGCSVTQPAGQLWPVEVVVCPLASGSVVQSSPPGVRASTNRWSHAGSVSYDVQNVIDPPPAGTAISRVSLLYETSAICE